MRARAARAMRFASVRAALVVSALLAAVCLGFEPAAGAAALTTEAQTSPSAGASPPRALPDLRDVRLPDYPRGAIEVVATLTVRFTIDTQGRVAAAYPLDEDSGIAALASAGIVPPGDAERFRKAATDAVARWRYDPPTEPATAFVRFEFYPRTAAQAVWHSATPPPLIIATRVSMRSGAAATAVRVGGNVPVPKRTTNVDPEYANVARVAGIGGAVVLELVVSEAGDVVDARVLRSVPLLDDGAAHAVHRWQYEPLLINGQPTPFVVAVAITYDPDSRAADRGRGVVIDPSVAP